MNKSHITYEQVETAYQAYRDHGLPASRMAIRDALIAAFPEQQSAAFGPLVVTEDMAEEINYAKDIREELQSFVNRHAIKPIAFADRYPENQQCIYVYDKSQSRWEPWPAFVKDSLGVHSDFTHWLPASALPIPEAAVDAKESAWREYCSDWRSVGVKANRLDFLAGYEAAQAGGKQP